MKIVGLFKTKLKLTNPELRTKIIADVDTGQIDVRDVVIPESEIEKNIFSVTRQLQYSEDNSRLALDIYSINLLMVSG